MKHSELIVEPAATGGVCTGSARTTARHRSWPRVSSIADLLFGRFGLAKAETDHAAAMSQLVITVDPQRQMWLPGLQNISLKSRDVINVNSLSPVSDILSEHGDGPALVIVNLDEFPCLDDIVCALLVLRSDHPSAAVIIGSAAFQKSDFSSERKAIADVSVRLPASETTIMLAVSQAIGNTLTTSRGTQTAQSSRDRQGLSCQLLE